MAILMSPEQYYLRTKEGQQELRQARRAMLRLVRENLSEKHCDIKRAVEKILAFTQSLNPIGCRPGPRGRLRFHTNDVRVCDVSVPRAVSILRTMCARLGVIANENRKEEVSLYGGTTEFPYDRGDGKLEHIELTFSNTPGKQEFEVWARGVFDQQ